jgi:hypothetical protein
MVREEFYDVTLEIAAYAKKHLEFSRKYADKLPKNSHFAFLQAIEAEIFLDDLEKHNFDIFEDHFRQVSKFRTPYKMYRAAKAGRF